ncbi:MAG: competence/damage-inducible protein A [Clostridiales bacterium]|nr:competence/damage-inducible protein A [Clostridiales bacterium]
MTVELISVGTEILMGNIVNTNAAYLSAKCAQLGMSVYRETSVGDNKERLEEAIRDGLSRSDIVILTGGLGPTKDDLTKETAAKVAGKKLVTDQASKKRIQDYFQKMNREIADSNWKQADMPEGSIILPNKRGTAPGCIIETADGKRMILMPGPPYEMQGMFEQSVYPYLEKLQPKRFYSKMVKICGIGESMAEKMVSDLIEAQDNPTIAPYCKTGEVHFRVTASADSVEEAKKLVKPIVKELKNRFKENVFTTEEEETLEQVVVKLLKKYGLSLVAAESCTAGMFTARIANVPGASDVLSESFVTYSNKAKRKYLDVSKSTLKKYGAVSEKTAKEMVKGAAIGTDSDVAVAITGFAGPDSDEEHPVGLVYIACYVNEKAQVEEFHFNGDRQRVRELAVENALDLLRRCILSNYAK